MLLAGSAPLTCKTVTRALVTPPAQVPEHSAKRTKVRRTKCVEVAKPWNALAVEVGGRHGRLPLRAGSGQTRADVWFEDGERESVELSEIKLLTWTTWK
jgi:hypothetical protein